MNYSAILIAVARWAAKLVRDDRDHAGVGPDIAVVFCVMAIEALVNELATAAVTTGRTTDEELAVVEKQLRGIERMQALLGLSVGGRLDAGKEPAQAFQHITNLRNALVHYRPYGAEDDRLKTTLRYLVKKGYFADAADQDWPMGWPNYADPDLALWAYNTTCAVAREIGTMIPSDDPRHLLTDTFVDLD